MGQKVDETHHGRRHTKPLSDSDRLGLEPTPDMPPKSVVQSRERNQNYILKYKVGGAKENHILKYIFRFALKIGLQMRVACRASPSHLKNRARLLNEQADIERK